LSVEEVAVGGLEGRAAVEGVTEERVADGGEVGSDLVAARALLAQIPSSGKP